MSNSFQIPAWDSSFDYNVQKSNPYQIHPMKNYAGPSNMSGELAGANNPKRIELPADMVQNRGGLSLPSQITQTQTS